MRSVATVAAPARAGVRPSRALCMAIGLVGASVCAISVIFVAWSAPPGERVEHAIVELLVIAVPIGAGLYALRAPPNERFGLALVASGFFWSTTALGEASSSTLYSIGRVAGWFVFPSLIFLLLAYPNGRVTPGLDRLLFRSLNVLLWLLYIGSALLVSAYPLYTPWSTCVADCPPNAFMLPASQPAIVSSFIEPVRELLAIALFAGVLVSLGRRWLAATQLQRRTSAPVMFMGALSITLLAAFFVARRVADDPDTARTLGTLWGLCVAGIAAAFFVGLVRRRLQFGRVLAELAARLSDDADLAAVRDALAAALDDPALEVLVPDGPVGWLDTAGDASSLPPATDARVVTIVRDAGQPAVALVHDAALRGDADLLAAVGTLVLGTMRHRRATSRLANALRALGQSRGRIAVAADEERARIERDLHDGAQQRLMTLRIRLSLAEELLGSDPPAGVLAVHELGDEVDRTLDELRSLAHGVYPALLNDRGLGDALRSLAREVPLRVHLHTPGIARLPRQVETAVYFTCAEAVQNAVKHARTASGVWITVTQTEVLTFEVRDDGPGFTPPVAHGPGAEHAGLRNMRDRLDALGGRLTIDSAPGRGTRIIGVVPLG